MPTTESIPQKRVRSTNPRLVSVTRTEHYKVAAFSFIDIEATISGEFENRVEGLQALHTDLNNYHKRARRELKKAFDNGEFEWLADVE